MFGPFTIQRVHVNGNITMELRPDLSERINVRRVILYHEPTIVLVVVIRGETSKHLSYSVCEDLTHCCSPVHDPKFLVKTVHSPRARVTHESGTVHNVVC